MKKYIIVSKNTKFGIDQSLGLHGLGLNTPKWVAGICNGHEFKVRREAEAFASLCKHISLDNEDIRVITAEEAIILYNNRQK